MYVCANSKTQSPRFFNSNMTGKTKANTGPRVSVSSLMENTEQTRNCQCQCWRMLSIHPPLTGLLLNMGTKAATNASHCTHG